MSKVKTLLIFLGSSYYNPTPHIERYLPYYLSKNYRVICFEYPKFLKIVGILSGKIPIFEHISKNLIIYHSFGFLPYGRRIPLINFLNHFFNILIIKIFLKDYLHKVSVISYTPEYYLISFLIRHIKLYYLVIDEYSALPWWKNIFAKQQLSFLEKNLLPQINKIIVVTDTLYVKYSKLHQDVSIFIVPTIVKQYLNYDHKINIPTLLEHITKPIVGFIGSIHDWKINLDLLIRLIKRFKNISFLFIGTFKVSIKYNKKFLGMSNFYFLKSVDRYKLPIYLSATDVCIVPYKVNLYGKAAYPVKIMEYLAMGKPVVTTALPSIKYLNDKGLIYWARNDKEFIKFIKIALKEKKFPELIKARMAEARKNDWEIRIKEFIKLINE